MALSPDPDGQQRQLSALRAGTRARRNSRESVLSRVRRQPNGCWRFAGLRLTTKGYAQISWQGRRIPVHRLIYEFLVGPLPPGARGDHTCRNRWCVNPEHIDPVSNRENILRGIVPTANRELCKQGLHAVTSAADIYVDSEGTHRCRECRLESKRAYHRRRAART